MSERVKNRNRVGMAIHGVTPPPFKEPVIYDTVQEMEINTQGKRLLNVPFFKKPIPPLDPKVVKGSNQNLHTPRKSAIIDVT